jgi:transposase-like protein
MSKKSKFNPSDKYRVALEAIKGELTQAQITSKYQVHATQISKWRRQALEYLQAAFSNKLQVNNLVDDYEKQLAELYRQVGKLKVENDFLKKKCDLFG